DQEGQSYEDALQKAQELGFAEADPTADVDGLDAARKMVILARLCFFTNVELDDVEVEGISNISLTDINYGNKLDLAMKLIGFANRQDGEIDVSVEPTFLSKNHPLTSVNDEYNAVYVDGENVGETMFYGPGAGSLPTATAVMSDVVEAMKNMLLGVNVKKFIQPRFKKKLTPANHRYSQFYLRLTVKDETGAFATISDLFNQLGISFERILQTPAKQGFAEIIVVTHKTSLEDFQTAMKRLDDLHVVEYVESPFRVEGDAYPMSWSGLIKGYESLLPVTEKTPNLTLYEGNTHLYHFSHLSEKLGINLYGKFEGLNPTGSFKDRGMVMAVAKAKEAGSKSVICASTGNTSAAAAAYAAKAGMKAIVVIPEGKVAMGKLAQAVIYGAEIVQISGNFDDALKMVQKISETYPVTLVNSVNPYRLEGQKTAAFEVIDQLGGSTPDILA